MDQITLAVRFLTALGIDRKSPLLGPQSWIAWATMLVSTCLGGYLGRTTAARPLWAFFVAMLVGSCVLAFLTSFVYPLPSPESPDRVPALAGFWLTQWARSLVKDGTSMDAIIQLSTESKQEIWPALSRGSARVVSDIALSLFCVGMSGTVATISAAPSLALTMRAWITDSDAALNAGTIQPGNPLPVQLSTQLTAFQNGWNNASASEKEALKADDLSRALKNAVEVSRLKEENDAVMPDSMTWATQAVQYFSQNGPVEYRAAALQEEAALDFQLAQAHHRNLDQFRRYSEDANNLMSEALAICGLCDKDRQSAILRLWSRSLYDLARPGDANHDDIWDLTYLDASYQKIREAIKVAPHKNLKNCIQLAQVVQKIGAQPARAPDDTWTQTMRDALVSLRGQWLESAGTKTDPDSRIPPLNVIAVLTLDTVDREVPTDREAIGSTKSALQNLDRELESEAIERQSEVLTLLPHSMWHDSFQFDVQYDLMRMYAMHATLLSALKGDGDPAVTAVMRQAQDALRGALSVASQQQSREVISDLDRRSGLRRLTQAQKASLRGLLD